MAEQSDDDRCDVVRRLFYLITTVAEDAAELSLNGQSAMLSQSDRTKIAAKLRASGEMMEIVASAIRLI